jgi:hypothetical protein
MDALSVQTDWSGGIVQSTARDRIPENAAYDIYDGLLDDEGEVYLRGGLTRVTAGQLGTALTALWEAQFSAGRRTLGVSNAGIGVIDATGTAWTMLSAGSTFLPGAGLTAQIADRFFFPYVSGGVSFIGMYGGSRKTAAYSTGTVNVTNGSATVTGTGTAWLANLDAGMFLSAGADSVVIKSVDSNTQVTLVEPYPAATLVGSGYSVGFLGTIGQGQAVAAVGGRLLVAQGRKVMMSKTVNPDTGQSRLFGTFTDYHEFPADVIALAVLRDRVFVFHKAGIHVISGVALEIVDAFGNAQHSLEKVSGDVVLRSSGAIAPWRDAIVLAAVDGVYIMGADGSLEPVSRAITPMWQGFSEAGSALGQMCTFRDHVFVPVPGAAQPTVLVGRLDRRVKTPSGKSAPWTRFVQGRAQLVQALAVQDPSGAAKLRAGTSANGYLLDATDVFQPYAQAGVDAVDEGAFPYYLSVAGRDVTLGLGRSMARDVVVGYDVGDLAIAGTAQVGVAVVSETGTAAPASLGRANHAGAGPLQRVFAAPLSGRRMNVTVQINGAPGARLRSVLLRGIKSGR